MRYRDQSKLLQLQLLEMRRSIRDFARQAQYEACRFEMQLSLRGRMGVSLSARPGIFDGGVYIRRNLDHFHAIVSDIGGAQLFAFFLGRIFRRGFRLPLRHCFPLDAI